MGLAEHRIGRVVFDIGVPDRGAVIGLETMIRAQFEAVIAPAFEAALDRIDRPGELIRFGRLEVDLGTLGTATPSAGELASLTTKGLAGGLRASASTGVSKSASAPDDAGELADFLESGVLPWAEPGRALIDLSRTLMALDATGMTRLAARLRTVLLRRRAAERLVRQMPAILVRRLLLALLPGEQSARTAGAIAKDVPVASEALVPVTLAPTAADVLRRVAIGSDLPELDELVDLCAALGTRRLTPQLPPAAVRSPEVRVPAPRAAAPSTALTLSVPVHAAGGVLLYPFLATFFGQLGLLDGPDRFRDEDSRCRAVVLAHHAATGADEAPEPETVLFKLLCGMELADPVPRDIEITNREREETDGLLTSVIAHWKRLGQTSPAGLRDTFLLRPGQLQLRGDRWRLLVESRGVDVLLDGLPWTLSRVKTPFMRDLLTVDWRPSA